MVRTRSTVITVAVLVATAIAVQAVAGVAVAQEQDTQIDDCTTINESGTYELNQSIGVNQSADDANATNESGDGTAANEQSNNTTVAMETGAVEDDANASACIAVEASDVTVDGNGNTLDGSDASELNLTGDDGANATATNATDDANESVVNGIVVRPAAGEGGVSNVTLTNVTVENWYIGVYVQDASGVTLENVTFENNTVPGFRLVNSTGISVQNANQSTAGLN